MRQVVLLKSIYWQSERILVNLVPICIGLSDKIKETKYIDMNQNSTLCINAVISWLTKAFSRSTLTKFLSTFDRLVNVTNAILFVRKKKEFA
jgi:hypothetical protein